MATNKLKVALIGYGAMGREIESLSANNNIKITEIFEIDSPIQKKNYDFDVAIDFSLPESVLENVKILAELKKNIVIGTTGWYNKMNEVETIVNNTNIACVWGSNFSIGMQMFFNIIDFASNLVNNIDNYDIMLHELHHKRKKDSPSGTAISLAEIILENVDRKKKIDSETVHEVINPEILHLSSTRGGEITGTHTVYFDSIADTIELTHRAKNRSGFALGAITAAHWIKDKKGFYSFNDLLKEIWNINI